MVTEKKAFPASPKNVTARFPIRYSELDRFKFGKRRYHELLAISGGAVPFCLDVACGAKPFPKAHVLCDLNIKPVPDRSMRSLVTDGKPFVLCDSRYLPFKNEAFDFVTSYYLIEHMDDPWSFFKELKRVSKHGYVQCPSWFSELLYGEEVHQWIVLMRNNKLYIKSKTGKRQISFGFVFHRLYKLSKWRIMHAILDETLHLFTICYSY
jgi:SAM-dependent methyltransferase